MIGLRVKIERFTDPGQPGWVECTFVDAVGTLQVFEEKAPVVSGEGLDEASAYPRAGVIACQVVGTRLSPTGREWVTVDTECPWGIRSRSGDTRFEVFPSQLTRIDQTR